MTVREYILSKFASFGLTDGQLEELFQGGLDIDTEYTSLNATEVGKAMCGLVAEMVFFPRQDNISEGGFSVHWNFDNLGKYYVYLCKKYGVETDKDILAMLGISTVIDRTSKW